MMGEGEIWLRPDVPGTIHRPYAILQKVVERGFPGCGVDGFENRTTKARRVGPQRTVHTGPWESAWGQLQTRVNKTSKSGRCTGSRIRTPVPKKGLPTLQASTWTNFSIWVYTWAARKVGCSKSPQTLEPPAMDRAGAVQRALGGPALRHPSAGAHAHLWVQSRDTWLRLGRHPGQPTSSPPARRARLPSPPPQI